MRQLYLALILIVSSCIVSCQAEAVPDSIPDYPDDGNVPSGDDDGDGDEPDIVFGSCSLSSLFSDGMVLQRGSSVNIFGTAEAGTYVKVTPGWDSDSPIVVSADRSGHFSAKVNTPSEGGPYEIHVNDIVIRDVMIGEVWLCSGQSNMQFRLGDSDMDAISQGEDIDVRTFWVPAKTASEPQKDIQGGEWIYGNVDEVKDRISAVGYYFGRKLNAELGVPVGIICAAKGSSYAEEWMSSATFEALPEEIRSPYSPDGDTWAGCWYNSMISPLFGYRISGIVWYQGESNVYWPQTYYSLIMELARNWRTGFGDMSIPFYLVQLPSYANTRWTEFRKIQENIADDLTYSGFVPTIDTGEERNIHPVFKRPAGERVAELALSNVYSAEGFRSSPPRIREVLQEDGMLRLKFSAVKSLVVEGGGSPEYFEICGKDGRYYQAKAEVDGKDIILYSDMVSEPVSARYYWTAFGKPNLFAEDGWPIAPFSM